MTGRKPLYNQGVTIFVASKFRLDQSEKQLAKLAKACYEQQYLLKNSENFYFEDPTLLLKKYHRPLLALISFWLHTDSEEAKAIYINELSRYIPKVISPEDRFEYLRGFTGALEEVLAETLSTLSRERLAKLHKKIAIPNQQQEFTLLTVGDCVMTDVRSFLRQQLDELNINHNIQSLYFSADQGVELSTSMLAGILSNSHVNLISLSFLTYEGLPIYRILREKNKRSKAELEPIIESVIHIMDRYIHEIRKISDVTILLHNVSGLPVQPLRKRIQRWYPFSRQEIYLREQLNIQIEKLAAHTKNCIVLDEHSVLSKVGVSSATSPVLPKKISKNAMFHTSMFGYYLGQEYRQHIRSYLTVKNTKLIAVDFDNTLWKGVMVDEEVEQYQPRQTLLKQLSSQGILLAAVSKNSIENIRWEEMLLQPEDFVSHKINWNLKAQSIEELAIELNIGKDSFLFIDDNPVERELVHTQHPEVRCLDPDIGETWKALSMLLEMPETNETEEAKKRTELYRVQAERKRTLTSQHSYAHLMSLLNLKITFRTARIQDLPRVHELFSRTNQFNTTTIRYTVDEITYLFNSSNSEIYLSELEDKFGKLGIVSVAVIQRTSTQLIFESFVMSCRAMGFGLEKKFLSEIIKKEAWDGEMVGKFIPTSRNQPASELYPSAGFTPYQEHWLLNSIEAMTPVADWFDIEYQ